MTFEQLGLSAPILAALNEQGYEQPSPIQEKAIPPALEGRDVLGCAQTGTGKTCAFATPILQRLTDHSRPSGAIRALILTPTRELAIQIGESFDAYGKHLKLRHTVIFGGVSQNPQVAALKQGCDILVATPGRLMDLHNQGFISLEQLEIFVLDEADRMLDMGFIHDVKKILKWLPPKKQTLFFSATMPPEITNLVNSLLKDPVRVAVNPVSSPVEAIEQTVYLVDRNNKTRLLAHLVQTLGVKNALVFTRTKHGANKVARDLTKAGISAAAIHGNKSQTARQQALSDFKSGQLRCLVATDIAARGLDIEELSHVFNYNLPEVPETYVHRIGRTGRAGRNGQAIAFCDFSEKPLLKEVEKLMHKSIPVVEDHPYPMEVFEAPKRDRHGKVINEEDAEAREAARSLRKARDEAHAAQKAAQKAADTVVEKVKSLTAQVLPGSEEGTSKRRRRGRGNRAAEAAAPLSPAPMMEEEQEDASDFNPADYYTPAGSRPKMVRSGTLMDTGDAMPRTEFHRPNPLDSDVIMDATARLLSSRRMPSPAMDSGCSGRSRHRGGQQAHRHEEPSRRTEGAHKARRSPEELEAETASVRAESPRSEEKHSRSRRRKKPHAQGAVQVSQPAGNHPAKAHSAAPHKKQGQPAPKQARHESAPAKKRSGGRRGMPPEPNRSQHKDSTEQPSLMKPYYLDLGR